jgi:hypothetical protein
MWQRQTERIPDHPRYVHSVTAKEAMTKKLESKYLNPTIRIPMFSISNPISVHVYMEYISLLVGVIFECL